MTTSSNLQLRAVLLTLLLAGGEGARIGAGVENMLEADTIRQGATATHGVFGQLSGGSPVCGDMTDPVATVKRYEQKRAKLTALSASVLKSNCMASCPVKINEIKWRIKEFKSCTVALSKENTPAELRTLPVTLTQVSTDLITVMKKHSMFKAKDGCDFQPQAFKPQELGGDGTEDWLKSLFGKDCGSEESVNSYIESLPESEREMLTDFMKKASKMIQIVQKAEETGESKDHLVAELEADMDSDMEEVSSSLLALDSEGALDSAEGTSALLMFLILIVSTIFFLLLCAAIEEKGLRLMEENNNRIGSV